tara:strand:- start:85 stop:375 length:291 start_codon:yes stop_codon:yes gene_type:complete
MSDKSTSGIKIITINRKASFNFFFKEILEAGIVLKGSEIKSVRDGKVNIAESYAIEKEGEIFLINSHIPIYKQASIQITILTQKENCYLTKGKLIN